MAANDEYSHSNKENLLLPIQMQLSEKLKRLSEIFIAFLETVLNFKHFEKKWASQLNISQVTECKRNAYLKHN